MLLRDRFDPRYFDADVLFRYHAGWAGLSFSRASGATLIDRTGTLQEVGQNVPRIDWSHGRPALRLEPQRTNLVPNPRLDTDSNGDGFPDGVVASAHADYTVTPLSLSGGVFTFRVDKVAETGGWGGGIRIDIPGIVQGDVLSGGIDVLVTPGSTPLVGATRYLWEYANDATGQLVTTPAVQYPGDGQWHRLLLENKTIEQVVRANTFRLIVRSGGSGSDPIGGSVTVSVRRPQIERGPTASSLILPPPGAPAAATRATETVTAPWPHAPQPMTLYVRIVETGGVLAPGFDRVVEIGSGANRIRVQVEANLDRYQLRYDSGGQTAFRMASAQPAPGQVVELMVPLSESGARLVQAIDGGSPAQTSLAALPLPTTWGTPTLTIGGGVQFDLLDLIVLRGSGWTMDAVRDYLPEW